MKKINLTMGKHTMVDDEDYEYLNQWRWYASKKENIFYAARTSRSINGTRRFISMHRVIMKTPRELQVDHIDGNGLNNQKINLRNCTNLQNSHNQSKSKNNTSGYKGVRWDRRRKYWMAEITINGKRVCVGCYKDKESAAMAYNSAAIKRFGEFARINTVNHD